MRIRRLFVIGAFVLVAAACGDGSTDQTVARPPTTSTLAPTTTSVAPTTTAAPATTTTVAPATTDVVEAPPASELAKLLVATGEETAEVSSVKMEARFEIEGVPDGPDTPLTFGFAGAFDNENGAFAFTIDLSAILEAAPETEEIPEELVELLGEMEMRVVGETAYIKFPFFNSFLGVETDWLSVPAEDVEQTTSGFTPAAPSNPAELLEAFGAADGQLEEVGRESVRGVDTTHYRIIVDMETLLSQGDAEDLAELEALGPLPEADLPIDIWIGDDGLLYRWVLEFDGTQIDLPEDEQFDRMLMTFEMFDYGVPIVVDAPDPSNVTDASQLGDIFGVGDIGG